MVKCPRCKSANIKINAYRKFECKSCSKRFTTISRYQGGTTYDYEYYPEPEIFTGLSYSDCNDYSGGSGGGGGSTRDWSDDSSNSYSSDDSSGWSDD